MSRAFGRSLRTLFLTLCQLAHAALHEFQRAFRIAGFDRISNQLVQLGTWGHLPGPFRLGFVSHYKSNIDLGAARELGPSAGRGEGHARV